MFINPDLDGAVDLVVSIRCCQANLLMWLHLLERLRPVRKHLQSGRPSWEDHSRDKPWNLSEHRGGAWLLSLCRHHGSRSYH
jgi:hypothetical protein